MPIRPQERFNAYSHLAGVAAATAGTAVLAWTARSSIPTLISVLVYGLSTAFLFTASTLYHAFKRQEGERTLRRKLDHLAIFIMIAGTYTPVCTLYLQGAWRWSIIGVQWALVGFGVLLQFALPAAPRLLQTALYVVMGWLAVIPLRQILVSMTASQAVLMFAGGAAFTLGAIVYATRRPRLRPGCFGFHELFHLLVLLGAGLHYAMILIATLRLS